MAAVTSCDRCGAQEVHVEVVLERELCPECIADVRRLLTMPPARTGRERANAAVRLCRASGRINAAELSAITGEPHRKVYERLYGLHRQGRLRHVGDGDFVPASEAAE